MYMFNNNPECACSVQTESLKAALLCNPPHTISTPDNTSKAWSCVWSTHTFYISKPGMCVYHRCSCPWFLCYVRKFLNYF